MKIILNLNYKKWKIIKVKDVKNIKTQEEHKEEIDN